MSGADRPLLVYDGDCGFCLRWIARWRRRVGDAVEFAPYQAAGARFPDVDTEQFRRSVWLFEPDGRRSRAAEAVLRSLAAGPRGTGWPLRLYRRLPGARAVLEAAYGAVSRHRGAALRIERALVGDTLASTWRRSRAAFRVGLALVAALALLSLLVQLDGLVGSRGISPIAPVLEGAAQRSGVDPAVTPLGAWAWESGVLARFPTLFWFARSDAALHGACLAGLALALLLLLDVAPALCALGLGAIYLSLVQAGGVFLGFQWDSLLVETCALAALYLPWRLLPARLARRPERRPPALARWLLAWLVFRFLFESGVVKLTWGDPTWRDLTALSYHYATQPLPHLVSVWAARLPMLVHQASALGTYLIEMGMPFLVVAPRRPRAVACAAIVGLQVLIGGTGNYGCFNLLTIVLALALLDDDALAALGRALTPWRRRARAAAAARVTAAAARAGADLAAGSAAAAAGAADGASCGLGGGGVPELPDPGPRAGRVHRVVVAACALPLLAVGALQVRDALRPDTADVLSDEQVQAGVLAALLDGRPVDAARVAERRLAPFQVVNPYGLFRVMTTTRPEIVVRATEDGETWVEYDFRWKPDALDQPPRWCQPHMPRLDWRLWFEALAWERTTMSRRPYRPSPWFGAFLVRLAEAEPAVLDLLASDPFDGRPPQEIRAGLFLYTFAADDEVPPDGEQGRWWRRQQLSPYWLPLRHEDLVGGDQPGESGR